MQPRQLLAVITGFPASRHAVGAHALNEGHEGADAAVAAQSCTGIGAPIRSVRSSLTAQPRHSSLSQDGIESPSRRPGSTTSDSGRWLRAYSAWAAVSRWLRLVLAKPDARDPSGAWAICCGRVGEGSVPTRMRPLAAGNARCVLTEEPVLGIFSWFASSRSPEQPSWLRRGQVPPPGATTRKLDQIKRAAATASLRWRRTVSACTGTARDTGRMIFEPDRQAVDEGLSWRA